MMRSLYSAVSGLKTHQTRMDVIGNNIANVNTEAFKSSRVTFTEIMYQTTASASGGNAATGTGGINAKQIGLGVSTGATSVNITTAGAAETTGNPFDLKLTDSESTNFFIVSDGTNTFFTRSGSYYVDGNGYLCMTSTGYTLMGWQIDPNTGEIKKDTVTPLQVMSPANQTSAPEATTLGTASGILDKNDPNVTSDDGYAMTLNFYDDLGYAYTAKFSVKPLNTGSEANDKGKYTVELASLLDSNGKEYLETYNKTVEDYNANVVTPYNETVAQHRADVDARNQAARDALRAEIDAYNAQTPTPDPLRDYDTEVQNLVLEEYTMDYMAEATTLTYDQMVMQYQKDAEGNILNAAGEVIEKTATGNWVVKETGASTQPAYTNLINDATGDNCQLVFNTENGEFTSIGGDDSIVLNFTQFLSDGINAAGGSNFKDIEVDFSACLNLNNGGKSTMGALKGQSGDGAGKKLGALTGVSVDTSGKVYGSYDNGNTVVLCQVAVAQFSNASGLEKVGSNCYQTTLNSGEFDGIGVEITADGSSMSTGELEMSNVDLSAQFTDMIITQRGFQANSRVITTSDTLLEELINLKR